ncbi:tRNA synthetases class II core domain (F) domain-containing protein [Ditylenchus destructor]|uniref:phenylalanine--tRNA ligase n=1 Tax=Ditylenchus destructor TaxID=166010 RepID=A0AAD4MX30_9BILA|nr:tRNA synthetases class II core domain (F) domain-containing protein [Ditylenchus destructor]
MPNHISVVDAESLLAILDQRERFRSDELAQEAGVDHQKIIGFIKSLQTYEGMIEVTVEDINSYELTEEGALIAKSGSHEYNVFQFVGENGVPQKEVLKLSFGNLGFGKAKLNGWVEMKKSEGGEVMVVRKAVQVEDTIRKELNAIREGQVSTLAKGAITALKKRKLVTEITRKIMNVTKGPDFKKTLVKPETELTMEMLATGSWRNKTFKKYNFEALGVPPASGHLHPLLKVRSEFRDIFFQMGFTEMPTNRYVESSFWNFDALFQPQQHPARDSHDTFFVSEPAVSTKFPEEYLEKVKKVHSKGGYGSVGYQYDWKIEEAQKNVLRTHTTAISARMLYQFAQREFKPLKMFSIDRVFRNETLDATHLAEFHQVEGVIAERNLSLAHVIGLFTEFFRKCGIENLRFKPTYNPYTEPSMEIFAWHAGLQKWVEIGNSGIFRPEMLLPMGLPEDVNVAGFGLSLERPTMIRYGISNIRELFGHKINLEMVYKNPICMLDQKL